MQDQMMQGGLTDLWLDDPYVLAAKRLIQWATEENEAGEVFPVSMLSPCPCEHALKLFLWSGQCFQHRLVTAYHYGLTVFACAKSV